MRSGHHKAGYWHFRTLLFRIQQKDDRTGMKEMPFIINTQLMMMMQLNPGNLVSPNVFHFVLKC